MHWWGCQQIRMPEAPGRPPLIQLLRHAPAAVLPQGRVKCLRSPEAKRKFRHRFSCSWGSSLSLRGLVLAAAWRRRFVGVA